MENKDTGASDKHVFFYFARCVHDCVIRAFAFDHCHVLNAKMWLDCMRRTS